MTITHLITATELEAMGSADKFELIQGELHAMSPSSYRSNLVLSDIGGELRNYVKAMGLGRVTFAEAGYQIESDPDTVIAPDVAFVCRERIPNPIPARGFFVGAPDLIVEVISPTDEPGDIQRKKALYDRAAVRMVWWIDPERQIATVHRVGHPVLRLTQDDFLDGEDVVPGFSIPLGSLFDF